jgi:hypothetical protein
MTRWSWLSDAEREQWAEDHPRLAAVVVAVGVATAMTFMLIYLSPLSELPSIVIGCWAGGLGGVSMLHALRRSD